MVPPTRKPATSPGARSATSGTGCQLAACPFDFTCAISDSAGITPEVVDRAVTTSIEETSGAAARTASSTASSSVTADDGQLLQLPVNAQPHGVAGDLEQIDVATVRAQVRPHPIQRVGHPAVHVVRMQAVHEEQAGHQVVGGQPLGHARVAESA